MNNTDARIGLELIRQDAIKVTPELDIKNSVTGKITNLDPTAFSTAYQLRYAVKGKVLSFIDEKNHWFFLPYSKEAENLLKENKYIKADFFVPCSDGYSYPVQGQKKWLAKVPLH